ncbi:MAG TPA: hypothetical protein VFA90_01755 [Terriglobales bacterium]|nr:hypothetical protein [Terriglobales bacterium]
MYVIFAFGLAFICYLRPEANDFDRYAYEALARLKTQPIQQVYSIVKHESPRAEASSIMDSPEHLAQLLPLYAIRPVYVELVALMSEMTGSPPEAIRLISSASYFFCGVLLGAITRRYLYSALVVVTPGIVNAARVGTPDILSGAVLLGAFVAIINEKYAPAILLLMASVWVRTDNAIFVMTMLAWLVVRKKLRISHGIVLAGVVCGSVETIDLFSGNYGWGVLFQYSFVAGKYPAEIVPHITPLTYMRVFAVGAESLASQIAPWLLLGSVGWKLRSFETAYLVPVVVASVLHFFLYPSPEGRYFVWAYLIVGFVFIEAMKGMRRKQMLVPSTCPSQLSRVNVA